MVMEGMGEIGEDSKKVRGGPQSGGNFIQGGDTGGATIWLRDLGPIGCNVYNCERDTHWVSKKNHGKAGAAEVGRGVVYSRGRRSSISGGKSVGYNLYW